MPAFASLRKIEAFFTAPSVAVAIWYHARRLHAERRYFGRERHDVFSTIKE